VQVTAVLASVGRSTQECRRFSQTDTHGSGKVGSANAPTGTTISGWDWVV
jgi:hypothetical protein